MVQSDVSNVAIYLRVRPVNRQSNRVELDTRDGKVDFNIPKDVSSGYINNQREHYEFRFNHILPPESKQDEVFEVIAKPVISTALEGINGTIFAYGQTGSGKTFTITGGPERYSDRGMIPRTISWIFKQISERGDYIFSVHVSYMEIYMERAYDLLDPSRDIKDLDDLPKVTIMEDSDGQYHMRNLSVHRAQTEEEALNLLFLGDTNRMVAETPMNMASSRSHCVFTLHLEARRAGEDKVRKSKLNLVDLAGSERVAKTGIDGATLSEAKFINSSLHFLEQVIMGLQERAMGMSRTHIPYRNSMMTMVLRDSLGGNCKTAMVTTVNLSQDQLDESISSCRFAQRVAMVSNKVSINEETDPTLVIKRLKQEIRELQEEVRMLQGGQESRGPLTPDERSRLRADILSYVADQSSEASLHLGGSMLMVRATCELFKEICRSSAGPPAAAWAPAALPASSSNTADAGVSSAAAAPSVALAEENKKLRLQVQQRDNEINILVSMLKKRGGPIGSVPDPAAPAASLSGRGGVAHGSGATTSGTGGSEGSSAGGSGRQHGAGVAAIQAELMNLDLLKDRNRAFELFRKSYRKNAAIEENKAVLKEKYVEAKALGNQVNEDKAKIGRLKQFIEQRRMQQSAACIAEGTATSPVADADEEQAKVEIEAAKQRYKTAFDQLRERKHEIEHLQMLLEQSRKRMAKDFEEWFTMMARQQNAASSAAADLTSHPVAPGSTGSSPSRTASLRSPGASAAGRSPTPLPQALVARSVSTASRASAEHSFGGSVPAKVLQAAQPLLTGDSAADRDILAFYMARQNILDGHRQ